MAREYVGSVIQVRHPRAQDPPNDAGWIWWAQSGGYVVTTGYGFYAQTQSFYPYEHYTRNYGHYTQRQTQWYTDFPEQGWLQKPNVEGKTTDFYEAVTDYGSFPETQSFRVPKRPSINDKNDTQVYCRLDQPQQTWLNPNIYDLGVRWPGIEEPRSCERSWPKRYTNPINEWGQVSWIVPSEVFDPRLFPRSSDDRKGRELGKVRLHQDREDVSWIIPSVVFDPVLFPRSSDNRIGRELGRVRLYQDFEDVKWIVPSVVFDPALFPRPSYDSRWGREPGKVRLYQDLQDTKWLIPSVIYDPAFWPAAGIDSQTTPKRAGRLIVTPGDDAWVFVNLPGAPPAFDPTQLAWLVSGDMTAKLRWWTDSPAQISWIIPAAILDPIITVPSVTQLSQTTQTPRRRWHTSDPPANPWIIPAVVFDPALTPYVITNERLWIKQPFHRVWILDPDLGWISINVPAGPAITVKLLALMGIGT